MVDIGAEGRNSDGGIFKDSIMGKCFDENRFHLPNARPVETDGPVLPYVLLADEAFPLSSHDETISSTWTW